jgi:hypothetical protein
MDTQPTSIQEPIIVPDLVAPPILTPSPKSSHMLPILISSLITALILFGGYFVFINFYPKNLILYPSPSPIIELSSPTPTADPTISWKTYTNTTHMVSFKYPEGWMLTLEDDQAKMNASIKLTKDEATIHMIFGVDGIGGVGVDYVGTPFVLDGNKVFKYKTHNTYNNSETTGITDSLKESLGVLMLNKKTYILSLNYPAKYVSSGESTNLEQVFDQVLSTFKFTN